MATESRYTYAKAISAVLGGVGMFLTQLEADGHTGTIVTGCLAVVTALSVYVLPK